MSSSALRFLRMSGTSIATPGAGPWITDFLNAAYFARAERERDIDDLRLAFCVLTTRLQRQGGRRLGVRDAPALHRAYGGARFLDGSDSPRGELARPQLLEGGARLLGDWFPSAYDDPERRGWGIAFETPGERAAHDPRRVSSPLGEPAPPRAPDERQAWSVYPAVPLASAERTIALMLAPERWPDAGSETGRFTPVRVGGLAGQTFEIEVIARVIPRLPLLTRGYVTATRVLEQGDELDAFAGRLGEHLAAAGREPVVPGDARARFAVELTTHEGHFLGRARSRLLVFEQGGEAFLRATGSWDPLPLHLEAAYRTAGREAQEAFWGRHRPQASMLAQMAELTAGG